MENLKDIRVLIVEDDFLVSEEIKRVLEKIGYTVIDIAKNGSEAISKAMLHKPDVILMDIHMPKMGGLEATKKIQQIIPTPVIMLTAYESKELLIKATEWGASGYIMKPPQSAKVERAITIGIARHKEIMEITRINTKLKSEIIQRKKIEAELRESEEHYRLLFNLLPYGGEVMDKTGIITKCSPSTAKMLGYNNEELVGMHISKLLTDKSKEIFHRVYPYLLAGKNADEEIVMIRKNKTELNVLRAASPILDSDGKVKSILALNVNITERIEVEQKMKQRDSYLSALNSAKKLLLSDSEENIFQRYVEIFGKVSDASRTYIFINSINKDGDLLMHQKAEYCAKNITPQIDNQKLLAVNYNKCCPRWKAILSKGENISGIVKNFPLSEREILEPQGIKSILIAPIVIDNKFLGFIGFDNCQNIKMWDEIEQTFLMNSANDLAEYLQRKQSEVLLQKKYNCFQTILDAIDAVVYVADMQTYELIMLNKRGEETSNGKAGGKCYNTIQTSKKTPCSFCTNHLLLDENGVPNKPYIWEFQNTISKQIYQCRDQAIRWPDGRMVRLEIAIDITKRKNMEEQLRITNLILRHDITNDLNVIRSAIRIFERTHKQEMLEEVNNRVEKSLKTIAVHRKRELSIGSFSGLKKYNLKDVIHKVTQLHPNTTFNIMGSGFALGDEAIYSIFENIVANAILHGKSSKVNFKLEESNDHCEISCIDYGIGIKDEIKNKVFEKGFYYGESGNTGMGLHIVRHTINNYGGSISVSDNVPKGTIFKILLKRYKGSL